MFMNSKGERKELLHCMNPRMTSSTVSRVKEVNNVPTRQKPSFIYSSPFIASDKEKECFNADA